MSEPLPRDFMKPGQFSWPQSALTRRVCLGHKGYKCTKILESTTRRPAKRCNACLREHHKELNKQWRMKNGRRKKRSA